MATGHSICIEDIRNLSLDSGLLASITRDNAYATIWSHVTSIASGAFRTCAFIVLLIFIMIEFLELSDRFSSNQLPDLLKPFSILIIKLALSITIINQSTTILNTIYNGFLDLSTQVNVTSSITMTTDLTNFNNSVDDMAFGVQIVALLVLFLCVLGTKIAWAFTQMVPIGTVSNSGNKLPSSFAHPFPPLQRNATPRPLLQVLTSPLLRTLQKNSKPNVLQIN